MSKFVCVRLVQMYGVDLSRFQFDFAMTWAVFFANADGTTYGRYGTRSGMRERSVKDISVAGFQRSAAAALALHDRYVADADAVRAELAGKQPQHKAPWSTAEQIPTIAKNARIAVKFAGVSENRNERNHGVGCIHCHFVPNNEILSLRAAGKAIPERLVWPFPMPWSVGLTMDAGQRATVRNVKPDSPAAKAGLAAGDQIERFGGQAILSTADLQWVLHNTDGVGGELPVVFVRGEETRTASMVVSDGWRRRLGDWRFVNTQICMQIAGFNGRPRGGGRQLNIRVDRVIKKRPAGSHLNRGDVLVAIDGNRDYRNLGQLTNYLLGKKPESTLKLLVRRKGRPEPFEVEFGIR